MGAEELPGESSAIQQAEYLHEKFEEALEDWEAFQWEHGDKTTLWNTVHRLIVRSRTTDDLPTKELYDALGVNEHYEDGAWRGDESVDVALDISGPKQSELSQGKHVSWSEEERTGVEFIDFGRKLVAARVHVEIRAHLLIRYLKHGEFIPEPRVTGLPPWNAGMDEWEPPDLTANNPFYWKFVELPFRQQIVLLERLTGRLGSCYRGRLFLAQLFEHEDDALFNPFRIVVPGRAYREDEESGEKTFLEGTEAIEVARAKGVSVFTKHPSALEPYYTVDGRVAMVPGPEGRSTPLEPHLTQVLLQLLPGLVHFYAYREHDTQYNAVPKNPKPVEQVGRFVGEVAAMYFTDDLIHVVVFREIDWKQTPYAGDAPSWDDDALETKVRGEGTWTEADTIDITKVMLGGTDSIIDKLELPARKWTTPLKLLSVGIGAVGGLSTMFDPTDTDPATQVSSVTSIVGVFASIDVIDRYLPSEAELAKMSASARRRAFATVFKAVSKNLARLGPVLDVIGSILDVFNMVREYKRGNYGAATGSALMAIGGGLSAAALWGGPPLLIAGVVVGLIGAVINAWFGGPASAITRWLETTAFGTGWDALDEEDFLNAEASTYGYRRIEPDSTDPIGAIDFARQISQLYSITLPIGVAETEFGSQARREGGDEQYFGRIEIEPAEEIDEDDIRVLNDGYVFLRPLPVYEEREREFSGPPVGWRTVSTEWKVDSQTPGDVLHRFSLADEPDFLAFLSRMRGESVDDVRSKLGVYDPAIGPIERWIEQKFGSDGGLDLEMISARTKEVDGDEVVLRWACDIWDMSNGVRHNQIFGWPEDELFHREGDGVRERMVVRKRFVELIYLSPEQVDAVLDDETVSGRPEELPTVSRKRVPVTRAVRVQ